MLISLYFSCILHCFPKIFFKIILLVFLIQHSYQYILLRIHWRLSMISKKSNKSIWRNVFWYARICIFWKCIQCTIHGAKTQMLKKLPLDKINGAKMTFLLFCKPRHIAILLSTCDSYMSWNTRLVSLKVFFLFQKMLGLSDFKTS